jgi:streptogramin lyase
MARRLAAFLVAPLAFLLLGVPAAAASFPSQIDLPDGWFPAGITAGAGATAYVGSLADGAIARVDLVTGGVATLAPGAPGRSTAGVDFDAATNRIWAAGAGTSEVRAYDATTGALLATYHFTSGFLNDVVATRDAVYVTDSNVQQLIVIPLGRDGALPDPSDVFTLPLTGDIVYGDGFNANGIVATRGWLILVQSNTGLLFRVDPATGETTQIDLGGATLTAGDGLELVGSTLYVVRNGNEVDVVRLGPDLTSGRVTDVLTADGLDTTTTAAFAAGRLWVVNARFEVPPTATTEYWLTRVDR